MNRSALTKRPLAVSWCLVALWCAGCAPSADEVRASRAANATPTTSTPTAPAAAPAAVPSKEEADFVAAVASGSDASLLAVRFRLASRPELGKPVTIDLHCIPDASARIDRVRLTFSAGEGLQMQGESLVDLTGVAATSLARHQLVLTPATNGVLMLHVAAMIDVGGESLARNFSVPLVVAADNVPRGVVAQ